MSHSKGLAESLSPEPIISEEKLAQYVDLGKQIKKLESQRNLINKEIKIALGKQLLENLRCAIEPHMDLYNRYLEISSKTPQDPEETAMLEQDLEQVGLTLDMLEDYKSGSIPSVLSHNKVDWDISGLRVSTSIQDRSSVNELRAIAYLRSIGREDLLTTKIIVDESALEIAVSNGEIDAREFKRAAIDEKLVVALTVK